MPMNENTYNEILKCYNHSPATVGRGWNQDETFGDTAYEFKIFDDFYYNLFYSYHGEF